MSRTYEKRSYLLEWAIVALLTALSLCWVTASSKDIPEDWTILPIVDGKQPECPVEFPTLMQINEGAGTYTCGTE